VAHAEGDTPGTRHGLYRAATVEELVFGTHEGGAIEERVRRLCDAQLGAPVSEFLFRATSIGLVFGLRLGDGRRVVLKVHQPRESRERLEAVHALQCALFRGGFPCPEPLAGPSRLGNGLPVVESLLDVGEFRDTHEPALRRLIAEALAWELELTRACGVRRRSRACGTCTCRDDYGLTRRTHPCSISTPRQRAPRGLTPSPRTRAVRGQAW
jgi:hypothetical protein